MAARSVVRFTCVGVYLWLLTLLLGSGSVYSTCDCPSPAGCTRPRKNDVKEVFVVTTGTSDFRTWNWESFTSVLATPEVTKKNLMCYSHQKQKKYGFIDVMTYEEDFNNSEKWIKNIKTKADSYSVDLVAVNLIDTLKSLKNEEVNTFQKILFKLKQDLLLDIQKALPRELICIVSWKPPCVLSNCNITDHTLYHVCDMIMIDANSFEALSEGDACKARATVPITHLALGVDEYVADGIAENRIILGVPWHGYKYNCEKFTYNGKQDSPCLLKQHKDVNNKTICDYASSRTKITIGELEDKYSKEIMKSQWSKTYQAPVFSHYMNKTRTDYQVWYENIMSLRMKYQYAHDFALKGIAIYYAEDLSNKTTLSDKGFNGGMWDWVLHGILKTVVTQPPPVKYHGGVVAGAAIGCLLLGVVMGIGFTCLAFRHRGKRSLSRQIPFKRDQMEYHDDDDNNLHL